MCEYKLLRIGVLISCTVLMSCNRNREHEIFRSIGPEESYVRFTNHIEATESFNVLSYMYFYNGAGVAIGDINNDGLEDIYFSSDLREGYSSTRET